MTFMQRVKTCLKDLSGLFRKSIGPLVVFLFMYYLVTRFALFPIGRAIWSKTLALLHDGYIGLDNVGDLGAYPVVIIIGLLLALAYCIITFLQIECAFVFVEYRYNDKIIGFKDLVAHVIKRTIKVVYPHNWPMLLLVVIVIPFVNVFCVSSDINSITVPEFIYTVITQRTPYFIAFSLFQLLLLYIVLRGLYVEITFTHTGKSFVKAFRSSAGLTKGLLTKLEKLCGLLVVRVGSLVLFSVIPLLLVYITHFVSFKIFGDSETFSPTMEILENNIAYPAIEAFSAAMTCAVMISLIVTWFHTDSEKVGVEQPELQEYKASKIVAKATRGFTVKVLAIIVAICMAGYCVMIPVCVQTLKYNEEYLQALSSPTEVIAHKGYTSKAPENTIPAMEKAIESGNATIVEFDVQATRDGVPVVIHDANAKALTGVDKNICDMDLKSVKKLDASHSFKSDKYKGTTIPTLEEYLKACDHRIKLLLEVKNYNKDPNLESEIMALLEEYDYLDGSCMIHSGSAESLKKIKSINPDIECGLIMTVAIGTFYDIPYVDFYSIETSYISTTAATEIHKRFKPVYVWTVDEQSVVEDVLGAGADGVICDDPDLVQGYIDEYMGSLVSYSNKRMNNVYDEYNKMVKDVKDADEKEDINTDYGD